MKRIIACILVLCLLLSAAACGKKEDPVKQPTADKPGQTTEQETEGPYVEELPAVNALDNANPIPADTNTL